MKLLTSLLLLFLVTNTFSQDSLVFMNEIKFSSDFEKEAFRKYLKEKNQGAILDLFLAVSPMDKTKSKEIENRLSSLTASIRESGIDKKKPEKKIKSVYDQVHNPLLKKYELENRFYDIFTTGNYNCVSATALYSLVFEQLGIPYEIKEEPTHVYLLGYPNSQNILVETTSPLHGYLSFNQDFKSQYVTSLIKQKVIGADEGERSSVDELFNKYYFKNEKVSISNLVGIQYMNDGIFLKDHDQLLKSYEQMEKAYIFYPSKKCEFLLFILGTEVLSKVKLSPKEKAVLIGKLSRFKDQGITNDMIKGEFINLTQELLFKQNDKSLYNECYRLLGAKITDKELRDEIDYVYHYENGRVLYNQGNYSRAKPFFEKALALQPNNVDLGGIFVTILAKTLRPIDNNKAILDSLHAYQKKYPSLDQFNSFKTILASVTVAQFGEEYDNGKVELAEQYKKEFEGYLKEEPSLELSPGIIGKAYSSACSYYFKKGQKAKAKQYLTDGLKVSPNNYELRMRMQMIH